MRWYLSQNDNLIHLLHVSQRLDEPADLFRVDVGIDFLQRPIRFHLQQRWFGNGYWSDDGCALLELVPGVDGFTVSSRHHVVFVFHVMQPCLSGLERGIAEETSVLLDNT